MCRGTIWKSGQLVEVSFLLPHVGPGDAISLFRFGGKHLYLLSYDICLNSLKQQVFVHGIYLKSVVL